MLNNKFPRKIALKSPGVGWVLDDIAVDYKKYSRHNIVRIDNKPDIVWSIDLFGFSLINEKVFSRCILFVQIHHIDENKIEQYPFKCINKAIGCIVPNKITEEKAKKYLDIPIYRLPYWILSKKMKESNNIIVRKLRNSIKDKRQQLIIGSFVKDGNGIKGDTPKLSKGPDILVDIMVKLSKQLSIKVVLGGYCRDWVIKEFKKNHISYVYMKKYSDINSLYDCLDYYLVTSRVEGGPQSILEASYRKIKILSTNVGIASDILHPDNICENASEFVSKILDGVDRTAYNYNSVQEYTPKKIISRYDNLFEETCNEFY